MSTYPVGDQVLPLEVSMQGKNKFYHFCEVTGKNEHYGICLHIKGALERGQKLQLTDCVHAIACDNCPAQALRREEIAADRALYYIETVTIEEPKERPEKAENTKIDKSSPSYLRGRYGENWHQHYDGPAGKYENEETKGFKPPPKTPTPKVTKAAKAKPEPKTDPKAIKQHNTGDLVEQLVEEQKAKPKSTVPSIKPLPGETPLAFARRRKQLMEQANG